MDTGAAPDQLALTIQSIVNDSVCTSMIDGLKGKIKSLERWVITKGHAFEGLKEMVLDLIDRVDLLEITGN